jgi:hypothetical protein
LIANGGFAAEKGGMDARIYRRRYSHLKNYRSIVIVLLSAIFALEFFVFALLAKGGDVVHFSVKPKNEPLILVNMQAKRATVGNSRFVRTHY